MAEASRQGVPPKRLRAGDLHRPFHGVRSGGPITTPLLAANAFQPRLAADEVSSHVTAALLWGIPLPRHLEDDDTVHVTSAGRSRARRSEGVRGHRSRLTLQRSLRSGLPVTGPVRT